MTAIDLRTEIVRMIEDERDTSILEAIRTLLHKLRRAEDLDDDITDEEVAEFDRDHAAYMRGDLKAITGEESVKRLRKAQVRDEAL